MATLQDLLGRSRGALSLPSFLATLLALTVFSTAGCGDDASSSNVPDASERDGDPGPVADAMQPSIDATAPPDADSSKLDAGGESCGDFSGAVCGPTEYCDFPDNDCGIADATGTCTPRPELCQPAQIPVCGCDDRDYGNECEAYQAGTDIAEGRAC
jgi:hypothetical protein